jgi:hypothetical protein
MVLAVLLDRLDLLGYDLLPPAPRVFLHIVIKLKDLDRRLIHRYDSIGVRRSSGGTGVPHSK